MGGSRCTYRTCTQRSDQVTHMFHYPVFDRVRCHQWITNAEKLNYLSLTLSQLKNKMICQHHFTDDSFMNQLKNKLKLSAVPTLDGPYCKPALQEVKVEEIKEPLLNKDDIENDMVHRMEKQAHMSVKYGDFLTNDIPEHVLLGPSLTLKKVKVKDKNEVFINIKPDIKHNTIKGSKTKSVNNQSNRASKNVGAGTKLSNVQKSMPSLNMNDNIFEQGAITIIDCSPNTITPPKQVISHMDQNIDQLNLNSSKVNVQHEQPRTDLKPKLKKVKIISEKRIKEPIVIEKEDLQVVSPSMVINLPLKKKARVKSNMQQRDTFEVTQLKQEQVARNEELPVQVPEAQCVTEFIDTTSSNPLYSTTWQQPNHISIEELPIEFATSNVIKPEVHPKMELNVTSENVQCTSSNTDSGYAYAPAELSYSQNLQDSQIDLQGCPNTPMETQTLCNDAIKPPPNVKNESGNSSNRQSLLKRSTPTKLKSKIPPEKMAAIEEKRKYNMKLRDILDSCLKNMDEEPESVKLLAIKKKEMHNQSVGEHLANVSLQNDTIKFFEARFQQLENTLVNKIEQHAQQIKELKKCIKLNSGKKDKATQTYLNGEASKRSLYQQISQYLSPDANSLIFEELFIDSCVSNVPKKRKVAL